MRQSAIILSTYLLLPQRDKLSCVLRLFEWGKGSPDLFTVGAASGAENGGRTKQKFSLALRLDTSTPRSPSLRFSLEVIAEVEAQYETNK